MLGGGGEGGGSTVPHVPRSMPISCEMGESNCLFACCHHPSFRHGMYHYRGYANNSGYGETASSACILEESVRDCILCWDMQKQFRMEIG